VWSGGRYIEYLFAFTYYKRLQEYYGKPLISSGCFSMYRRPTSCELTTAGRTEPSPRMST